MDLEEPILERDNSSSRKIVRSRAVEKPGINVNKYSM